MTHVSASNALELLPLQDASYDIWDSKYRLKESAEKPVDQSLEDTYLRLAKALSDVEPIDKVYWHEQFYWALRNGAIPAGRIVSNAGAEAYKPATSTINCTVSGPIRDSMLDILEKNKEAGLTLKAGCGIGYEFSTLRPRGAHVSGAGATTSGPLSFMDIFDKMCFTISSAGGRRGAQMATFDVCHPDVMDFIRAKREDGRLRQFNLSLLITDDFIEAVKEENDWPLSFPMRQSEAEMVIAEELADPAKFLYRRFPIKEDYVSNNKGEVLCRIYEWVPAQRLWDMIMASTYDYAEPGFILIDHVNRLNNNWFCENIRATNPCGEQPLPAYGSCLLGSINLTTFVEDAFTEDAWFDWERYERVISLFTRMLDNVVEINGLALEEQRKELFSKRRHGMGFLGLGSTLTMMRLKYGEQAAIDFTKKVSQTLAITGWKTGLELAKEKGCAPILEQTFSVTEDMMAKCPELLIDGYTIGSKVAGKVLHAKYSRYMQRVAEVAPEVVAEMQEVGCRFTHHSSIAPTGTISLSLANNASNGIEPSFAHHYVRNIIKEGRKTKEKVDVYSYELLTYRHLIDNEADPMNLPEYFVSSDQVTPNEHVKMQAAAQYWIDSSISKTINVPTEIPYKEFKEIYLQAYDHGLKGCTTFRFNPEAFQGVLVRNEDLKATIYKFTLEDGKPIELAGDEEVEYDGEMHSAANLYDALKEGYYGKL
ncbi:MAG: adenosylcobalamin-dependent ribonucleoside-diphosphate reductase [Gammaproteobacteria bacterium]|nr:adenosylcobalamin-dependent ribonucleoside-diphosphate reductase [Gammaproteobacteria bacterium]